MYNYMKTQIKKALKEYEQQGWKFDGDEVAVKYRKKNYEVLVYICDSMVFLNRFLKEDFDYDDIEPDDNEAYTKNVELLRASNQFGALGGDKNEKEEFDNFIHYSKKAFSLAEKWILMDEQIGEIVPRSLIKYKTRKDEPDDDEPEDDWVDE